MKKRFFLSLFFISTLFFPNIAKADETPSIISNPSEYQTSIIESIESSTLFPRPKISIPGLSFSNLDEITKATVELGAEDKIVIPFIGEYLAAMYRFSVIVITFLAVLMIIVAGLQYMIPSSGGENQSAAKERIKNSVIGLLLAVGSYMILAIINPALVKFRYLSITFVPGVPIEDLEFDKGNIYDLPGYIGTTRIGSGGSTSVAPGASLPAGSATTQKLKFTGYDDIFRGFAQCIDVDWRILKGFAYHESRFKTTVINKYGFVGLFQTKPKFCRSILKRDSSWKAYCDNESLKNPYVSTAVGVRLLQDGLRIVQNACGNNLNARDTLILLYMNHNNGGGGMRKAIKNAGGCFTGDRLRDGLGRYWDAKKKKGGGTWTYEKGVARYNYAEKVANTIIGLGVTSIRNTNDNKGLACTLNQPPAVAIEGVSSAAASTETINTNSDIVCSDSMAGKRVLIVGDSITANPSSYGKQLQRSPTCSKMNIKIVAHSGKNTTWMKDMVAKENMNNYDYFIVLGGVNGVGNFNRTKSGLETMYKQAKEANTKVVAITITPWKAYGSWNATNQSNTININNWIKSYGRSSTGNLIDYVIDGYRLLGDSTDPEKLDKRYLGRHDVIHFNSIGHKVLASHIAASVFQ